MKPMIIFHVVKSLMRPLFAAAASLALFTGCDFVFTSWEEPASQDVLVKGVWPFDDVGWRDLSGAWGLDSAIIPTLSFNNKTVWPFFLSGYAGTVLERGENPGLGIRGLHSRGLTGEGVTVAIIGQPLPLDHPEYAGKVVRSHDAENFDYSWESNGSAVLSLLAGKAIGTAPGANVVYAGAQSEYYLPDCLRWIIDENKLLPAGKKIRAVAVSVSSYLYFQSESVVREREATWDSARGEAEREGILVLDCAGERDKTMPCFYDRQNPDSVEGCPLAGNPGEALAVDTGKLYLPTLRRTTAAEYARGDCGNRYYSSFSGPGWSCAYLAGVLALGWQQRPELTGEQMLGLAFTSAFRKDGGRIINPAAFIDSVRAFH
jgi:serine protease AprX